MNIRKMVVGVIATVVMAVGFVPTGLVFADVNGGLIGGVGAAQHDDFAEGDVTKIVQQIINIILYVAGVLAVGFLVFGGIKYVTSAGDSSKVKAAKDTILYAVIGLAVTILAYAIVGFVIDAL